MNQATPKPQKSAMETIAMARPSVDACERILGRKLSNSEYVWIVRQTAAIDKALQERNHVA